MEFKWIASWEKYFLFAKDLIFSYIFIGDSIISCIELIFITADEMHNTHIKMIKLYNKNLKPHIPLLAYPILALAFSFTQYEVLVTFLKKKNWTF